MVGIKYCCQYGTNTIVEYSITKDNMTIPAATTYDVCGTLTKPVVNNGTSNSNVVTNGTTDGNSTIVTNGTLVTNGTANNSSSTVYVDCYYDEFNVAGTLSTYMASSNWERYSGLLWPFGIGMCLWIVVSVVTLICASMGLEVRMIL